MDEHLCRDYGWTLDECDRVDRDRVRFMWAVRTLWDKAQKINKQFEKSQQSWEQNAAYIPTVTQSADAPDPPDRPEPTT